MRGARRCVRALAGDGERLAAVGSGRVVRGFHQQAGETPGLGQIGQTVIARPGEERRIGIEQMLERIDQYANRQPIENGLFIGRRALALLALMSHGSFVARHIQVRLVVRLAGIGRAKALAQPQRQFAKGVPLDRTKARGIGLRGLRTERDDVFAGWRLRHRLRGLGVACVAGARHRGELIEIAADTETAIAAIYPVAVEHRQAGQFDRQAIAAAVHRPCHAQSAPGVAACDGAGDLVLGIERKLLADFGPRAPERGSRAGADQFDELIRADGETALRIHLPHEAQWMPALRGSPATAGNGSARAGSFSAPGGCGSLSAAEGASEGVSGAASAIPLGGASLPARGSLAGSVAAAASHCSPSVSAAASASAGADATGSGASSDAAACSLDPGGKVTINTVSPSRPNRSTAIGPADVTPSAWPCAIACSACAPAPSAASVSPLSLPRVCASACRSAPSGKKAATAAADPASRRRARSSSDKAGPARSLAATSTAGLPSASVTREQAQVSARPIPAPNPRSRSMRCVPSAGRVVASCAICAAAG